MREVKLDSIVNDKYGFINEFGKHYIYNVW